MAAGKHQRRRLSPWARRLIMALLLAVFMYAAAQLMNYANQNRRAESLQTELAGMIETEQPSPTPQRSEEPAAQAASTGQPSQRPAPTPASWTKPEILDAYRALWQRNNDLVGWLQMDALYRVDFPVVQRDQSYYLDRDFDGKRNMNGTAFLDASCSIWPRDDNLIVYAHNMKSGAMFGELHELLEKSAWEKSPLTAFNTIYERGSYVPVAAFLCTVTPGEEFFNYTVRNFSTQAAFEDFIARAKALSRIDPPFDTVYGDDLLTLVTCYDEAGVQRVIVLLRRVRWDEDISVLRTMWQ